MTQYAEQHFTSEAIAADHGRYARAPLVKPAEDTRMQAVQQAKEVLNQIKTEDNHDDSNSKGHSIS